MGVFDIFKTANVPEQAVEGAVKGVMSGIGDTADTVYSYVTGHLPPDKQAAFEMEFAKLRQAINLGANQINLADAQSGSNFRGGWRPALGWVCALSLGSYYIPQALAGAILWLFQCSLIMYKAPDIMLVKLPVYPIVFDMSEIIGLVASLLGLAGIRSFDLKQRSRT